MVGAWLPGRYSGGDDVPHGRSNLVAHRPAGLLPLRYVRAATRFSGYCRWHLEYEIGREAQRAETVRRRTASLPPLTMSCVLSLACCYHSAHRTMGRSRLVNATMPMQQNLLIMCAAAVNVLLLPSAN